MHTDAYRKIVCSLLRGEPCDWPESLPAQGFVEFAQAQGIILLLSDYSLQIEQRWPKSIHQAVMIAHLTGERLLEQRKEVIQNLFQRLNQLQIKATLFKGAANAYLIYPKPILRQHADVDLFINVKDYAAVVNLLKQIGFEVDDIKPTKFGPYQATAILKQNKAADILIDLHWRINNRLLLANALSFNEAWDDALLIKDYGDFVHGLSYQKALLAACIHEAGSLPVEREKLIGMYDVVLLVRRLVGPGLQSAITQAKEKGICEVCLDYIEKSIATFGNDHEKQLLMSIKPNSIQSAREASSKLLKPDRSWLEDQRLDWLAVGGINNQIEYIISKVSRKLFG